MSSDFGNFLLGFVGGAAKGVDDYVKAESAYKKETTLEELRHKRRVELEGLRNENVLANTRLTDELARERAVIRDFSERKREMDMYEWKETQRREGLLEDEEAQQSLSEMRLEWFEENYAFLKESDPEAYNQALLSYTIPSAKFSTARGYRGGSGDDTYDQKTLERFKDTWTREMYTTQQRLIVSEIDNYLEKGVGLDDDERTALKNARNKLSSANPANEKDQGMLSKGIIAEINGALTTLENAGYGETGVLRDFLDQYEEDFNRASIPLNTAGRSTPPQQLTPQTRDQAFRMWQRFRDTKSEEERRAINLYMRSFEEEAAQEERRNTAAGQVTPTEDEQPAEQGPPLLDEVAVTGQQVPSPVANVPDQGTPPVLQPPAPAPAQPWQYGGVLTTPSGQQVARAPVPPTLLERPNIALLTPNQPPPPAQTAPAYTDQQANDALTALNEQSIKDSLPPAQQGQAAVAEGLLPSAAQATLPDKPMAPSDPNWDNFVRNVAVSVSSRVSKYSAQYGEYPSDDRIRIIIAQMIDGLVKEGKLDASEQGDTGELLSTLMSAFISGKE